MNTASRLERLRARLNERGLAGMLVQKPPNRRYLSGFTGSSGMLLVLCDRAYLATDFRYLEQAAAEAPGYEVITLERPWIKAVRELLAGTPGPVAFESDYLSYDTYLELTQGVPETRFVPEKELVEGLRVRKDDTEVALLRRAIQLADEGAAFLLSYLKPGLTEREVALELEFFLRHRGASGPAFPFIVASGGRSSLPHGEASARRLEPGDLVTVDFGAVYEGYHSDLTRTFVLGQPTLKQRAIYDLVLAAQEKGLATLGPGVPATQVDAAARQVIAEAGYGEYFGHALGHGVGLAIHEAPTLSAAATEELQPGMVVTVEPGVYIPGWGGVRTEDVVLITTDGAEVLSQAPKHSFIIS